MPAIKISKTVKLNLSEIIKYQLIHHCFVNNLRLNVTELNCLTLLGELGKLRLTEFRKLAVAKGILGSEIGVSNCLSGIEHYNLFTKQGIGKKLIYLNPDIQIETSGSIILDLKLYRLETNESTGYLQNNSKKAELTRELC